MGSILTYGLSVAVVGMLTVFVGLIILIGMVKGLKKVLLSMSGKKSVSGASKSAQDCTPIVIQTTEVGGDEIVAVITAAVTAMMEAEGNKSGGFVVRSIRRVNNAPAWNRAGREEQVYSRM